MNSQDTGVAAGGSGRMEGQQFNYLNLAPFYNANNAAVAAAPTPQEQLNRASKSPHKTLLLRQWIKHSLQLNGDKNICRAAASSAYIKSSIKVAISLTNQIIQAEKLASCGVSKKLDVLVIGSAVEWAAYTKVHLKEGDDNIRITDEDDRKMPSRQSQPIPPYAYANNASNASSADGSNAQDLNKQAETFLQNFEFSRKQSTDQSHRYQTGLPESPPCGTFDWESGAMIGLNDGDAESKCSGAVAPFPFQTNDSAAADTDAVSSDLDQKIEAFFEQFCARKSEENNLKYFNVTNDLRGDDDIDQEINKHLKLDKGEETKQSSSEQMGFASTANNNAMPQSSTGEQIDYLNVDSAEICCPEGNMKHSYIVHDDAFEKLQRMFQLALLFYELFTAGEVPPPELQSLASYDGAFVSLSTLTGVKDSEDGLNISNEPKRRQGPKQVGLCKLSFEYLLFRSLPGPICHLIFNMLDSVYGDLSGDECYTNMVDVKSDLQLMLDKPKFLRGLDTSTGLQLNQTIIPRDQELQVIQVSYRNCLSGSSELALIKGESGSGKSWLAQRVGRFVVEEGGFFLMGKFDQMNQSRPFSALVSAFNQYCDLVMSQIQSDWAKVVVTKLHQALGNDASYLALVLPKLSQIMGLAISEASPDLSNDSGNALQRIQYLICQFVEVISLHSILPVTLFVDDVHWADSASISVLKQLVTQARNRFFFIASCRDDEMRSDHMFWSVIERARTIGVNVTTVKLDGMSEEVLNHTVSDLLCLSPRVVKSLASIVYTKTKGNPLFFSQLMLSLYRDGLLRIDLASQRWVWDEDKIYSTKLPDNVALIFIHGIKQLEIEVQLALHTLSMFGASGKVSCIKALESRLGVNIISPLKKAVAEGLVSYVKDSYHFGHDKIQAESYNMIQEQDRLCNHLTYGKCLAKFALETSDNDMFFLAVNQINLGGPSAVTAKEDYFTMANYNLEAGKRAMAMSNFHTAFNLFDNGINFLRKNHWRDNYQFSLEIFDLAAKTALASGKIQELQIITDHVLRKGRCLQDKLNAHFILISSSACTSQIPEALEKGLDIVSQLGEVIPNPSHHTVDQQMQFTLSITRGISHEFSNCIIMTDTKKLSLMRFLAKLSELSFFANHLLHSCLVLKMVQITVSCGLCVSSPRAFAEYGSLLARQGNIQFGSHMTMLGKSLLNRFDKTSAGEVIFHITEVQCFVQPLQSANEFHIQGEKASLSAGDTDSACYNRLLYCTNLYWSGVDLSTVKKKISEACLFMKEQSHKNSLFFMSSMRSTMMIMAGGEAEIQARKDLMRSVRENNNRRLQMHISFHDMYLSLILQEEELMEHCEKFNELEICSGCVVFHETVHTFIAGLAAFKIYRKTRDSLWYNLGEKRVEEMKAWANQGSPWNFKQKLSLLEAERHHSSGNVPAAKHSYKDAIELSCSHKYLNDEALAYELAGQFYLDIGDFQLSLSHFTQSHEKYQKWGAIGKAGRLFSYINEKFTSLLAVLCPFKDNDV